MRIGRIMVALVALPLAAFFSDSRSAGTAVNIAHRLMDKVSSLT